MMRADHPTTMHHPPANVRLWTVAIGVSLGAAGLGLLVLRPWSGPVTPAARGIWVMVVQMAMMMLVVMTWVASRMPGIRHRLAARAGAAGLSLQMLSSIWANQISPGVGLDPDVEQIGRMVIGGLSGVCLITMIAALLRHRGRHRTHDLDAIVDAAVVGGAAAVVAWEYLIVDIGAGRLAVSGAVTATVTVTAATAIFVRLMLSPARQLMATKLLGINLLLAVVVVVQFAGNGMTTDPAFDHQWELMILLNSGTAAAALLHPSFRRLTEDGAGDAPTSPGISRAITLCVAVIVPSAVSLFRAISAARSAEDWSVALSVPPAFAGVLITLGVAWRLARLVREREETQRLLRYRSLHDHLTALPNRAYLIERLEHQVRRVRDRADGDGAGFGLMFLDLDGFKTINDTYGHVAGDMVLVGVARRLTDTVRTDDFVGRMAGDEFVLLCGRPADPEALDQLADRVRSAIEAPLPVEFGVVTPRVSIGVVAVDHALASADDAVSDILRTVDARMYERKRATRTVAPNP